ncbi:MAG TPA: S1C family serine protease [Terriglobales bacterium]|nr:S1C family serine protease [Terriglobales bacterium]
MASSVLETLSNEFAAGAEAVGGSVVAIYGRRWMPSSGIQWREGVIVTANHTIRREEDITVLSEGGKSIKANLAGRDPSTDLAVLKVPEGAGFSLPQFAGDVKLGHFVLALGRSRGSSLVASAGIVGGLSGEWQPRRGGRLDQHIRLDLELYPGFSGGPLVNAQGKVVGINTRGLARGRGVTIPNATVNRVVDELLEKGHIARPYLGLAMQPVTVPETLRAKLASSVNSALLVVHVEASGPAEKAGVQLGDLVVELHGKQVEDTGDIQDLLSFAKVGDTVGATILRSGAPVKLSVKLEDRPTR